MLRTCIWMLCSMGFIACDRTPQVQLEVGFVGQGRVLSEPAGIDCGPVCKTSLEAAEIDCGPGCVAQFPQGTTVTLRGVPTASSAFILWAPCSDVDGPRPCSLTLSRPNTYRILAAFGNRCTADGWCREKPPMSRNLPFLSVWGTSSKDVWVAGYGLAHWDGSGWQVAMERKVGEQLLGIWGSAPDDYFAVGASGEILHYDGQTWHEMRDRTGVTLSSVWGAGPRDVWAVGSYGTILHYDGQRWTQAPAGNGIGLRKVRGTGAADVWAVGSGGLALHFDGTAWTPVPTGTDVELEALWCNAPGDCWAAGSPALTPDWVVLHYDGGRWKPMAEKAPARVNALWADGVSNVWGIAGNASRWNGNAWSTTKLEFTAVGFGTSMYDLWGSGPGDLWAVGTEVLHRQQP